MKKTITKKEVEPVKHLEVKTLEHKGIKVTVMIDYDKGEASLVEQHQYKEKRWVFANRGLEYMRSWGDILEAMQNAVDYCKKELEHKLAVDSAFTDRMVEIIGKESVCKK